jgi:hypothetical protein
VNSTPGQLVHEGLLDFYAGCATDDACSLVVEAFAQADDLGVVAPVAAEGAVYGDVFVLVAAHQHDPLEVVEVLTAGQLVEEAGLVGGPLVVEVLHRLHLGHPPHVEQPSPNDAAADFADSQVRRTQGHQEVELLTVAVDVP